MNGIETRLKELGLQLPEAAAPVATYVPTMLCGPLLYVSGQLPFRDGAVAIKGRLGFDLDLEQGQQAARLCALNILAQARAALDGFEPIVRLVRLGGFVAATPEFTDHPAVINGASDLMVDVMGEAGKHARAAVGVSSLPRGAAVEIEAIFEVRAGLR
jgi:enamine deaminase RidA (YjgF/YER057c/UK114 family)